MQEKDVVPEWMNDPKLIKLAQEVLKLKRARDRALDNAEELEKRNQPTTEVTNDGQM